MTGDIWFTCWRCGCSDVERTPAEIPDLCPIHAKERIRDNAGRTIVALERTVMPYGFLADGVEPFAGVSVRDGEQP